MCGRQRASASLKPGRHQLHADQRLEELSRDDYVRRSSIHHAIAVKHRHVEWLTFPRQINRETPTQKSLHLICDNDATHTHPKVEAWLSMHSRIHVHSAPILAAWLNMVERFFRDITIEPLRSFCAPW